MREYHHILKITEILDKILRVPKFFRLTSNILVWFGRATKRDIDLLTAVIKSAEKIILTRLPTLKDIYFKRLANKTNLILKNSDHPAYDYFELLPSGKRYRHFKGNKRFVNSTFPQAVRFLNSKL